ncbi:MAG: ATP-binding cassette domain-containing protein, partial [Veillonellales bacterium]
MLAIDIKKQLADFTLAIAFKIENDILVLFGPSGCGKTTTLRCIAGLAQPDAGSIVLNEKTFYSSRENVFIPPRCRKIGYVFQEFALFPHMNVEKNVYYGVKKRNAATTQLYEKIMPVLKIDHLKQRQVQQLSGGEKQRVALARALMAQPQLLLLDEPLSSLDKKTRLELQTELKQLQQAWSIPFILVT